MNHNLTIEQASAVIAEKINDAEKLLNEAKEIAEYFDLGYEYSFEGKAEAWESSNEWYYSNC